MNLIAGVDNFGKAMTRQLAFVDKSLFIKEVLDNNHVEATIITRPRRFGKTFNMSMLHHFLASDVMGLQTKGMFDHLKIAQCGAAYMEHQGKYPVIFISFKNVGDGSFENAYRQLRTLLQKTYREHRYLMTSTKLYADEKEAFQAIIDRAVTDQSILENALQELSRLLHQHHGVKPWLLIDEYDTPLHAACIHDYYDAMITFMRNMFGSAMKGNSDIYRAVVTGILRISKESLFSQLNNPVMCSILNEQYAEHFGFTESEVDTLFKEANLETSLDDIRAWYNGYRIGQYQMYNPWSIANCMNQNGVTGSYWVNTSGNDLIKKTLASAGTIVKEKFELILSGHAVEAVINEHMVFSDLETSSNAVWSLLLFSGYLTALKSDWIDGQLHCCLKSPNQEVGFLYANLIVAWFSDVLGEDEYRIFLNSLATGKLDDFLKILKQYLMESMSYFDTKGHHPEKFYHGFVLGLIVGLSKTHMIRSNKESGYGRYDVMLIPKDTTQLGVVLEFKVADENVPLLESAQQALAQVNERGYEAELQQSGIQKILKIGLAFRDKDVEMMSES